jgi:hypothetical protein
LHVGRVEGRVNEEGETVFAEPPSIRQSLGRAQPIKCSLQVDFSAAATKSWHTLGAERLDYPIARPARPQQLWDYGGIVPVVCVSGFGARLVLQKTSKAA